MSPVPNLFASLIGIGTAPDPNNPLSVYGPSALFNGATNFNVTVNKGGSAGASSDTASFIFEDGFSGRAQIGLCGDDNFHFKVSPNGSTWTNGITIDATTGAVTLGNARTALSDAAYTALTTDRLIAYTALTAARIVSLPAASTFPAGTPLLVIDESGSCSASLTITISRAGSDTIDGTTSAVINSAYGYLAIESNGTSKWTIVDQVSSGGSLNDADVAFTGGTIDGVVIGGTTPAAGHFTTLSATGQLTSTVSTGTAPIVVSSTTNVANLNASSLSGATFAAPGPIGSGTASTGAFTTLSASSTVSGTGFSAYLASPPAIGGTTPAALNGTTLSLARHAVADAAYSVAAGISIVAYTSISAARAVTLPAASSFNAGQQLLVVDESGSCTSSNTITLNRAGSDTINGATSAKISAAYGYLNIESNG